MDFKLFYFLFFFVIKALFINDKYVNDLFL